MQGMLVLAPRSDAFAKLLCAFLGPDSDLCTSRQGHLIELEEPAPILVDEPFTLHLHATTNALAYTTCTNVGKKLSKK